MAGLRSHEMRAWQRMVWLCAGTALVGAVLSCSKPKEDEKPETAPPPAKPAPVKAAIPPAPVPSETAISLSALPVGSELRRVGDEIMIAGRMFHTGARVVLWTDPGGYDAYRTERRYSPWTEATWVPPSFRTPAPEGQPSRPARFGVRDAVLNWPELEQVRGGGWPLELLQQKIDQFVIHYDVVGASQFTFKTLQDDRGLSVHFMLDVDGTIYQTLDVKERAFHATTSNYRSIGIEVANRGGYESDVPLREFYAKDDQGPYISLPARFNGGGTRVPGKYRPARKDLIRGKVNDLNLAMYDYTPEQYEALARLTATLCTVLPKISLDYPKDSQGRPLMEKLPDAQLDRWQGLIGHYCIQKEKYDPGPAFQWDWLIKRTASLMTPDALGANARAKNNPVRLGALATMPTAQPATLPFVLPELKLPIPKGGARKPAPRSSR